MQTANRSTANVSSGRGLLRGPVATRKRRILSPRRVLFAATAILLLSMTSVSYLADTGSSVTLTIATPSRTANGLPVEVNDTSTPVSIIKGKTQSVAGHQLFRVEVGEPSVSDRVRGVVFWLNSNKASQVLSNPNSYIEIGFFHDSGNLPQGTPPACPSNEFKTENQLGVDICVTESAPGDTFEEQLLTPIRAIGTIVSKTADQQYLYVLATINVPGGAPPGQQPLSGTLDFQLQLSLH